MTFFREKSRTSHFLPKKPSQPFEKARFAEANDIWIPLRRVWFSLRRIWILLCWAWIRLREIWKSAPRRNQQGANAKGGPLIA
jgi:hypothetical protein